MRPSVRHIPQQRGLTLVELLVTLVFVGLVMPAIMRGFATSSHAAVNARHLSEAAQLAHGKLEELLATQAVSNGPTQGDFGPDWPGYRWNATQSNWDAAAGVGELDVTVTWLDRNVPRSITISTLTWSSTGLNTGLGGTL